METRVTLRDLFRQRKYFLLRIASLWRFFLFRRRNKNNKSSILTTLIEENAANFPDKAALYYEDQKITYKQMNDYANKVSHYLVSKGIKQSDVVVLYMENRIEFLIYLLGVIKMGGVVSLVNSTQLGQSLKHSIDLVEPKAVLIGEELVEKYEEVTDLNDNAGRLVFLVPDNKLMTDVEGSRDGFTNISKECQNSATHDLVTPVVDDHAPALYIYTSGTTGLPKATIQTNARFKKMIPAGMLLNPLKEEDVLYCTLPLYHGTALLCWITVLTFGSTFALRRKFSAGEFWDDIDKYKATCFGYVGELCRYLLNTDSPKSENNTLRAMMGNGLRPDLWMEFKERFQIDEIREAYSASESTVGSMNIFNIDKTVGFLVTPFAIVKYDEETEEPLYGSDGRLQRAEPFQGGLLLGKITKQLPFTGYTQTQKNESKILNNVFKDGDSWFNSGDVVKHVGCRHIQFMDRTGDTFRWKGENVSTSEVEQVVNQFPGIEESVAYGVEVPHSTGRAGMVAIKLEDSSSEINGKEFYEYLATQLPSYAMPLFFRINEVLERTPTFKYKKAGLKQDGYELERVKSGVQLALHSEKTYTNLDSTMVNSIKENRMKL